MKSNLVYNHNSIFQVWQQHLFGEEKMKTLMIWLRWISVCGFPFLPTAGTGTFLP